MKLFGRLMTTFAALAILPLVVMGGVWLTVQRRHLMAEERHQVELMTHNAAAEINLELARAVEQVQQLAASLADDAGLRGANLFYHGEDDEQVEANLREMERWWPEVPDSSDLVRASLLNPVAQRLRKFERVAPARYAEVLVTDRAGALYAATDRPSEFYHGDEDWWEHTYNGGEGAVVVSDPVYDEPTRSVSLDVSAPILDARGDVMGIVQVSHDIYSLLRAVSMLHMGTTGSGHLVNAQGRILLSAVQGHGSGRLDPALVRTVHDRQAGVLSLPMEPGEPESVVGFRVLTATAGDERTMVSGAPWAVVFAQSAREVYAPSRTVLLWGALVLLLPLTGLFLLAFFLQRWLLRPIDALHWASEQVAQGHLDVRVEIGHGDELEAVGREFDRMAGALQRHEETQRTEIKRRTEELRQTDLQARRMHDSVSATLHSIVGQISPELDRLHEELAVGRPGSHAALECHGRLRALAEDLADLSDVGASRGKAELAPVDLRAALESARRVLGPLAALHQVVLELPGGELPSVVADRAKLKQVLYGLISNAIKYGGRGSNVKVSVGREDGATCIAVHDEGAGPPSAAHSGIFYLLSPTPTDAPEDRIGLALPIIKGLVELHGGVIRVEGGAGLGSTFTFTLPDRQG